MCGIAGVAGNQANRQLVNTMLICLGHRGPDDSGIYQSNDIIIGQTRLSIIDLVSGNQPMSNETDTIWIVQNGEIYNFKELRLELQQKGHFFKTTSDTEVILHGYEEYGIDILSRLDGIFAFCIWDEGENRLILARDYFGVKPLHYHFDGGTLRFASEIKAILQDANVERQVDFQAMHYFLNVRYIPGEKTLFHGIQRLLPGHFLIFENNNIQLKRYFNWKPEINQNKNEEYFIEGIRNYLKQAIKKQLVSDVPLGVYLSGGLDSSSIVAMMSELVDEPIKTFTLGFNEPTDELDDAAVIARQFATDHHEMSIEAEPLESFPEVIWHVEEPKENVLQGYLLAKFARQYVKVVLGGLGGDELFSGYTINQFIYPTRHLHQLVPESFQRRILNPLSRSVYKIQNSMNMLTLDEYRRGLQMLLSIGDPLSYYLILRNTWDFDPGAFQNIYGSDLHGKQLMSTRSVFKPHLDSRVGGLMENIQWIEFNTKMIDDFLMNDDRTSMANGLEIRVPFLDRDLVSFALGIPVDRKMRSNQTKYLFRKAMKGILPDRIIQKKKWGFTFNPYYQFNKDLKKHAERILTRKKVESRGWFNYDYIDRIIKHQPNERLRWHYFYLWLALGLEIWAQMFIEGDLKNPNFQIENYYDE